MDHGIHIGGTVSKDSAQAVSTGLVHIMQAGFDYRMDQETVRCALTQFSHAVKVENVSIRDCNIDAKTVNT